jgi:hypothetical protein
MAYYRAEPIPCRQAVEDRLPSLWESAWRLDSRWLGRLRRSDGCPPTEPSGRLKPGKPGGTPPTVPVATGVTRSAIR